MTVELLSTKIALGSYTGPHSGTSRVSFAQRVLQAQAVMRGFRVAFSRTEKALHEEFVRLDMTRVSIKGADGKLYPSPTDFDVTAAIGLRDASGEFDDAFEGDVDCLVVAETGLPAITAGTQVALRADNGKHVHADASGAVTADRDMIGEDEKLTVEIVDDFRSSFLGDRSLLALRAHSGKFISAEGGGGQKLVANRTDVGPWETFMIRQVENSRPGRIDQVALRAWNGQYVCAENGGGRELVANRNRVDVWETFTLLCLTVPVGVAITPHGGQLSWNRSYYAPPGQVDFKATVTGSGNPVQWEIRDGGPGTLRNVTATTATYVPPSPFPGGGDLKVTITAKVGDAHDDVNVIITGGS